MPVGEEMSGIWQLVFSVGGARLHGLSRLLLSFWLFCPVVGRNASRTLSKRGVGRLTSARSKLRSLEWGDLERCVILRACFGVIVVLVGFSLVIVACILIPMVEGYWCGLTLDEESRVVMRKDSEIITNTPMANLLVCLC